MVEGPCLVVRDDDEEVVRAFRRVRVPLAHGLIRPGVRREVHGTGAVSEVPRHEERVAFCVVCREVELDRLPGHLEIGVTKDEVEPFDLRRKVPAGPPAGDDRRGRARAGRPFGVLHAYFDRVIAGLGERMRHGPGGRRLHRAPIPEVPRVT